LDLAVTVTVSVSSSSTGVVELELLGLVDRAGTRQVVAQQARDQRPAPHAVADQLAALQQHQAHTRR
jgi:hypothetical protein